MNAHYRNNDWLRRKKLIVRVFHNISDRFLEQTSWRKCSKGTRLKKGLEKRV